MKKIAVFNPNAGKGLNQKSLTLLIPAFNQAGIDVWISRAKHDIENRIREWCDNHPLEEVCFIVSGGDGTMHEAVNGAAGHKHTVFASIPAGSGNDFARHFGGLKLDMNLLQHLSRLHSEDQDLITYSMIKERVAVSNMGAGFDAEVAYSANRSKIKKLLNKLSAGKLVYVVFLIQQLLVFKPYSLTIIADRREKQFKRVWFTTISNQPYYGGGMKIAPNADTKDGLLDVTVVHGLSRIKFLLVFLSVFKGSHVTFKEVYQVRSARVNCIADRDVRVHADGEDNGLLPAGQALSAQIAADKIRVAGQLALDE
ncbi:diacylglycerol/lipid kinase family protein [Jeotgalibacillus terrae]|uniref:Diacylglycerol/lipid kinase family protein n=1 Tax=Jeotgalibacillus terrae TaxID=587735 RepID=A0ABW5ZKW9_9BACL|nr:YegS/Rv2252/BmrU family lipid kinase [Jeotgalibacillus terrae]MBM7578994.1 YegS/Rv2252/BmrU family lipid kinase [Jeotgalibacillus terrae]